jgi:hypothetical protein
MRIKHCSLLSWVHESADPSKHKDHAQDCGTLIAIARSASGDPAMVFVFWMASILSVVTGILPRPAAGLLLDVLRMIVSEKFGVRLCGRSCENARKNLRA